MGLVTGAGCGIGLSTGDAAGGGAISGVGAPRGAATGAGGANAGDGATGIASGIAGIMSGPAAIGGAGGATGCGCTGGAKRLTFLCLEGRDGLMPRVVLGKN